MELLLQQGLEHQQKAVDAVCRVFEGVNIAGQRYFYENPGIDVTSPNIQLNISNVQNANKIPAEYRNCTPASNGCLCLDIKMETGTGKTYVYSKVMYELNKHYGLNKFIIAVPSLAIKAGTASFLQEGYVQRHFSDGCGYGIDIEVSVLEASKNQNKGRKYFPAPLVDFVNGTCQNTRKIHVLLVNMQLLTADSNKMLGRDDYDREIEGFYRPLDALRATKPVVIIDEPHRFARDNKSFTVITEHIKPQCIIRFGATFPEKKIGSGKKKQVIKDYENLLYDLNACESFNQGLIKGVAKEHLEPISGSKKEKLKITSVCKNESVNFQLSSADKDKVTHRPFSLKKGDSLALINGAFAGVTITAIGKSEVEFSNGITKNTGEELAVDVYMPSYQEQMLEMAIDRHFETERANFINRTFKIKTLALFFIDDIQSYRASEDGKKPYLRDKFEKLLTKAIEKQLEELKDDNSEYREYLQASLADISACHAGYFSRDNTDASVAEEVNEILHGKKKLLSFKKEDGSYNTRRFIFSKWTLKEGWDNPNVFTIAKLRSSGSEISKLQEVGRGLRLPVNELGQRISNESFTLNYIVDFTEEDFARKLVEQINGDIPQGIRINDEQLAAVAKKYNMEPDPFLGRLMSENYVDRHGNIKGDKYSEFIEKYPEFAMLKDGKIIDRNKKQPRDIKIRSGKFSELKELWMKLNRKYLLFFDSIINEMIENDIGGILESSISSCENNVITSQREKVSKGVDGLLSLVRETGKPYTVTANIIPYGRFLKKLSQTTSIPIKVLHSAFCEYAEKYRDKDVNNYCTEKTLANFSAKFKKWKWEKLKGHFSYKRSSAEVKKTALTDNKGNPVPYIAQGRIGTMIEPGEPCAKYLYDTIAYDSDLEKENILSDIDEVTVYGKIPRSSISIPTITGGTYSPDFMYVVKKKGSDTQELNVIVETKDVDSTTDLRGDEDMKITCAEVFFKSLEDEGVKVHFRKQIRGEKILELIKVIMKKEAEQP